jgi:murein DD-endopeptidase MepM/ murein hydrolase activator NlpD
MIIKISKSQLINILNEEENSLSPEDKFTLLDAGLESLASNSDDPAIAALGDMIISSQLGKGDVSDEDYMNTVGDVLPLDPGFRVSSGFGPRNIGGGASRNHEGIDLAVSSGTPAFAVANGVVKSSKNAGRSCGGFIKIKHKGYTTKYCHMTVFDIVKKGDQVKKGQLIGKTGGIKGSRFAGNSQGPHLHYEVLKGGTHVDPARVHTGLS